MKKIGVTIVDYGVGNLYSVERALEVCGANNICITNDPAKILLADRVLLPGVGAFENGMLGLQAKGLDSAICEFVKSGRPLLGICLGMQLFATKSYEFGEFCGMNLIPGEVIAISSKGTKGEHLKIPYIGWSNLDQSTHVGWDKTVLGALKKEQSVYLVHSFHFKPNNQNNILATYQYGGEKITAAIIEENVIGLQFHPEKSGKVGLTILSKFLNY